MTNDSQYVFISYKSEEIDKAREIQQYLEKEGYKCWRAPESLHKRGTQDYGNDIFEAIRNSGCLLFVLSNRSLCSDWVRKEVKYALEKCHKPLVPYVIDTIPSAKYESDELMISLSLQKQILNEDLSNDLSVILPYMRQCFGASEEGEEGAVEAAIGKHPMTEQMFQRLLEEGNYFYRQVYETWSKIDYLEEEKLDRPFGVFRQELENAVCISARALITAFRAIAEGVAPSEQTLAKDILEKLYKMTYDYSEHFTEEIFDLVEPAAKAGTPWACFVLHSKYYHPQGTGSESYGAAQIAFQMLSKAVDDENNPYAAILMGCCWQWGIGCELSGTRAKFWYEKALWGNTDKGQSGGQCKVRCNLAYSYLGRLYQFAPRGIEKDDELTVEYFKEGIDAKDGLAASRYGDFLWLRGETMKAVEQYINAYELGHMPALADLAFFARFDDDSDLDEKLSGKYSRKRILQQVEKADLPLWKNYCSYISHLDPDLTNVDALMHFASDGVLRKNPGCASNLADLIVSQAQSVDMPPWSDFEIFRDFLYTELKMGNGREVQYVKKTIACVEGRHEKGVDLTVLPSGYGNNAWPASPFWNQLILSIGHYSSERGDTPLDGLIAPPSTLDEFNRYVPYKFLEAIKRCLTENGTALGRVKEIWSGLRELDYEKYDSEQIARGRFLCVTQRLESYGVARLVRVHDLMQHLMDLIPEFPNRNEKKHALEHDKEEWMTMSFTNAEVNKKLQGDVSDFLASIESALQSSVELRLAKSLCEEEHRISNPALAVALDYYRLAYMWGSSSSNAINMATLFFVNNGRLRDANRNEGLIYYIAESLRSAIFKKEIAAVPLFLELSLFGAAVGNSRVEVDLQAIAKADALIFDMTNPSTDDHSLRTDMLKLEIACAMAAIYFDKDLYDNARCEQKWGVSSLYNPSQALRWLLRAHLLVCESIKSYGDRECDQIEAPHTNVLCDLSGLKGKIEAKLQEFGKRGYPLEYAQRALNGNQQLNGDGGDVVACGAAIWSDQIQRVVEEMKSEIGRLPWSFFPHVKLEEDTVDVAVSTDSTALLLNLLPGDVDYKVVQKQGIACNCGVPRIGPRVITLDFVTMLQRIGATLRRLEPDSTVEIGIVASASTCREIRQALDASGEGGDLNLLSYDELKDQIVEIFGRHEDFSLPPGVVFDKAYAAYKRDDYDASFPLFMELANQGYEKAYGYVGLAYELGEGVERNLETAIEYYKKAIAAHEHLGTYRLGMLYQKRGDDLSAYEVYKAAVGEGYGTADDYLQLAKMLEEGRGVRRDLQQAVAYYRKAMHTNDPFGARDARKALERLGALYDAEDFNVRVPSEWTGRTAASLYHSGKDAEDSHSDNYNLPLAVACYSLAAKKGHAVASFRLSKLYANSSLPIYDRAKSSALKETAMEKMVEQAESDPDLAWDAGYAYLCEGGGDENVRKAERCFLSGAKEADASCMWKLGEIAQREGRADDAFDWFLKAAELGQGMAMFAVASCYEMGEGTPVDREKAVHWYKLCAESHYAASFEAKQKLRELLR